MFPERGRPALALAPMDGVTDFLMRELISRHAPVSYCVTEFIRVSGEVPPHRTFLKDVPELKAGSVTSNGTPVQLQLLGGHPGRLAEAALRAVELGATAIDLNFGCPAPTVNRHDGGATILRTPSRVEEIVRAVREALPPQVPVSAKLRLGWDDPKAIFENASRAERGGASWITIHGRTKFQGYTPPAYWEPIGEVRRNSSVPVVANGEIWDVGDLKRCRDETGCEHFMVGRGVLADPGLLKTLAQELELPTSEFHLASIKDEPNVWAGLMQELVEMSVEARESERRTLSRMKQWLSYSHKRGSVSWFDNVKRCDTVCEFLDVVRKSGSQSRADDVGAEV